MRLLALLLLLPACGDSPSTGSTDLASAAAPTDLSFAATDLAGFDFAVAPTDHSPKGFANKLGRTHAGHFLVGMGNDGTNDGNDPAYNLGVTLDLHDHYLVGLSTERGWPTSNSNPDYAGKPIA